MPDSAALPDNAPSGPPPGQALAWRQVLFEHAQDAVFVVDEAGRVREANAAFATLLGCSLAQALQLHVWDWDRDCPRDRVPQLLAGDLPLFETFESRWQWGGGPLRQVELRLHRCRDSRGRLIVGTARDVTASRAIEAALRESERFLHSIADNLPDMVGYWDAQRVLRFANRAYREWFSPERDPVGLNREVLIGDPAHDAGEMAFAAALQGRPQRFEYALVNAAGEVRYAWLHYVPDWRGDAVVGLFALLTDISDLKQAELRLQGLNEELTAARDRAEAANRAKSAFLANISHEIRTPLNAIMGLAHLMRHDTRDALGAQRLAQVSEAANHLLGVINDVLDLSKIEAGKLQLVVDDFAVEALLTRACSLVAERARDKGLVLRVHAEGVPPLLRGDARRVSQALLNLLSNAVKFTDQGSVELRCESIGADSDGLRLRFSVLDTGVGVPADKVGGLFGAFEQVDNSTTRRHGGTGLGLAITRRLATLMGGEVGVHSVRGEGSCFWFSARFDRVLPDALVVSDTTPGVLAIDGCVQPLDPALGERLRGARVLLAEDNPVNRQLACELLGAAGVEVDVAQNGLEAVRRGRTRAYDLVLMDLQMPVMDGLAATRELRGQPQHARTPILAMTAEGFGVDWQACQAAGMDDHLTKPVEPDLLYAMLGRWLPPRATRATRGQAAAAATPAPAAPAADPARPAPADLPPVPATPEADATPAPDFSGIPGLTMARALLYLPGRDQVYARVLRQFSDSYRGGLQALLPALRSGQWADAKRQLHALRGACGAVGAVALMAQCQAVEQQLAALAEANGSIRSAEGLTAEAQAIDHQLARLIAAVDERFSGAAPAAPAPAETLGADGLARLTEAMDRLAAMLQVADFGAAGEFRALEPALCAGLGEDAARSLERALRAHDYDAALQALQVLRARLASSPAQ